MGLMGRLLRAVGAWIALIALLVAGVVLADLARLAWHDAQIRAAEQDRLDALAAQTDADLATASSEASTARDAVSAGRQAWNHTVPEDVRVDLEAAEAGVGELRDRAGRMAAEFESQLRTELEPQRAAADRLAERTRLACTGVASVATCGWASMREESALLALARAEVEVRARLADLERKIEVRQASLTDAEAARDALFALTQPPPEMTGDWAALEADAADAEARAQDLAAQRDSLAEQERQLDAESGLSDQLLATWEEHGLRLALLAAFILGFPYLRRTVMWWLVAPVVERDAAVQLVPADAEGTARTSDCAGDLPLVLESGEELFVRAGYLLREEGKPRTRFVYGGWRHPFTSAAAGLLELEWFRARETPLRLTLGNTGDPDSQLLRIDLVDHPGFVVHPNQVVALTGGLVLKRRWRLLHIHAWLTWQLRFVMATGTGSLYVEGGGHVRSEPAGVGNRPRVPQSRVLGFDGRLAYRCVRSRPFFSVLVGRRGLWDDSFAGEHAFVVARTALGEGRPRSAARRAWDAVWGAAERALGIG